ncbi:MAG: phosphatidylserine decarboxylase family protein [Deltaproteobacteria bacterium]
MDPLLTSIQPGGGICMRVELAWGYVRRWYLKTFRRGYVARMAQLRRGDRNVCPFEVLDPRDVKFYRNLGGYSWDPQDDPFKWRDQLPFARVGLAELWLISGAFFALAAGLARVFWALAAIPLVLALCIVWFFRNPRRSVPEGAGLVVSPADGKVVQIEEIEYDEYIGGPALLVGIFLSVFNVHINRAPVAARVIGLTYRKGMFLNAMLPQSARENERLTVRLEENAAPHHRMIVRQIAGLIARRIVCWVKPGDELQAGGQFGMIKLGSRTELVVPRDGTLRVVAQIGQTVKAGESVLVRYEIDSVERDRE